MICDVDIRNGYYGRVKTFKDGTEQFKPYGKEVFLNRVLEALDSDKNKFELKFFYNGKEKLKLVSRGQLCEIGNAQSFSDSGMDVTRQSFDCFVDSILFQEETCFSQNMTGYCHEKLGWVDIPWLDKDMGYRSQNLYSFDEEYESIYDGSFKVDLMGSKKKWMKMVREEVLPSIPLSIVLICAMASIPSALLSRKYPIANGIMHLCSPSSHGKSTALYLATSISGEPFPYTKIEKDIYGNQVRKKSLLQSFDATNNALIENLTGNFGVPIVIDELGKCQAKDLTSVIFALADGNGKSRLNQDLGVKESIGFKGTIITAGEFSIFEKCSKKLEGLHNRVFELNEKLTSSAEQSQRIKKCAAENNGFMAPLFAQHILAHGGISYVSEKYDRWLNTLNESFPDTPNKMRFLETFVALYLATAEMAKEAFDLDFDIEGIQQYFLDYLASGKTANVSLDSYQDLLKEFRSHSAHFYMQKGSNDISSSVEVWGRYHSLKNNKILSGGRAIVGEYLVRENIVDDLLKEKGYTKKQCVEMWKKEQYISFEADRSTRSRKIDIHKEPENVFVFYVFEDKEASQDD